MQKIWIGRFNRTSLHAIIRIVDRNDLDKPRATCSIKSFNDFILSKSPEMLLESLESIGPFSTCSADLKAERRLLTVAELKKELEPGGSIGKEHITNLFEESYFDPYSDWDIPFSNEEKSTAIKAGAKKCVDKFGAVKNKLLEQIDTIDQEKNVILIEPLQDWLLLRNILSISSRVITNYDSEQPLTKAGFIRLDHQGPNSYGIPLSFNTWYADKIDFQKILESLVAVFRPSLTKSNQIHSYLNWVNPFYLEITTSEKLENEHWVSKFINNTCTVNETNLLALTYPQIKNKQLEDHKTLYLVVEGLKMTSEKELANDAISILSTLFSINPERVAINKNGISLEKEYFNFPNEAWGILGTHENYNLITCEYCKRSFLSDNRSPNTKYCSDSCRTMANKS